MLTRLTGALVAAVLAVGCAATPTPSPVALSAVALPADAPLSLADCGWPADTTLVFAHSAELGQLALPDTFGPTNSTERVFAIVSSGRIEQRPMVGPSVIARGGCVRGSDGRLTVSAVPDAWHPPVLP